MRCWIFLIPFLLVFPKWATGESSQELDLILEKMANIEERLDHLHIDWLNRGFVERHHDSQGIEHLEFPGKGDRSAIREYVQNILATAKNKRSFSANDPEVEMLIRIGRENADILFDEMKNQPFPAAYYSVQALVQIADAEHKKDVLARLPHHRELVRVVLRLNWQEEARDVLLNMGRGHSQIDWMHAIARLEDDAAKEKLLSLLRWPGRGRWREAYETISELEWIPDAERAEAVHEAWRQAQRISDPLKLRTAQIAIGYGHRDALGFLVKSLRAEDLNAHQRGEFLPSLRVHTRSGYTAREILKWYDEYKDSLTFDVERRVFVGR